MSDNLIGFLMPALWGFLVGFVGWGACFRLIGPIATWLTETREEHLVTGVVRLIVLLFLVGSVLFALVLIPLLLTTSGRLRVGDDAAWRNLFGIIFMASMGGFFSLGIVRRVLRSSSSR